MAIYKVFIWKKAPFIRLLVSLIIGILVEWYTGIDIAYGYITLVCAVLILGAFFFIRIIDRYWLGFLNGIAISLVFIATGILLTWRKDIRHADQWVGKFYNTKDMIMATLDEPPVEKAKSIKANAKVSYIIRNKEFIPVKGNIILYFKKDSLTGQPGLSSLDYGSQIIFDAPIQEIKNAGNPGGFDYKRYALFNGITHQVYLNHGEFMVLTKKNVTRLNTFIYALREWVLNVLKRNIKSEKERGLAEALLIGYKDDLDQALVQSYTNTGVVHIIAISGMHLALVYWLLGLLCRPFRKKKYTRWLPPVIIITGLWLFSLLTGAQASILRSALMFTCIVLGESLSRKTSVYNTMALSAFVLLCINPYCLWDVGFQLSYAAVLSIIIFVRPVYNLFYIQNKLLDNIWKLNAVSIAAQILTLPLSIYHFHQFPNYFLLTNIIAVPLSSLIVLGEIFLCGISWIPFVSTMTGKLLEWMMRFMDSWIERIERLPFSLWNNLQVNVVQAILLNLFIAGCAYWLMERSKAGLKIALITLLIFTILRSISFIQTDRQHKIIVYNIPRQPATDFIDGRNYFFVGDTDLTENGLAYRFNIKPCRVIYRTGTMRLSTHLFIYENYISYYGKHILLLNKSISFKRLTNKLPVDLLLISKSPRVPISQLANSMEIGQVVFDSSVPSWKINQWKKDCDSLHISYYDVNEKGAFVMNLN